MSKRSIIKDSSAIRMALQKRMKDIGINVKIIVEHSKEFEIKGISPETMSRYFNNITTGGLTEEAIVYLCMRYGIPIRIVVGSIKIKDKKIVAEIPKYDEKTAKEQTQKFFKKKDLVKQQDVSENAK